MWHFMKTLSFGDIILGKPELFASLSNFSSKLSLLFLDLAFVK